MSHPPYPADEGGRLANLYCLELLDTPPEARFDRITRYACQLLNMPAAALTLVDTDREWFKSRQGVTVAELDRDTAPGAYVLTEPGCLVVADLQQDDRFSGTALSRQDGFQFYAAQRLVSPDGFALGSLAVMDRQARDFSDADRRILGDVAAWAEAELAVTHLRRANEGLGASLDATHAALSQQSHLDPLTRLWDRRSILAIAERELQRAYREKESVCMILADLDHFRVINDSHGRITGNLILQEIAERMRRSLRGYDAIGRYEGARFLMVLSGCGEAAAIATAERLRTCVAGEPVGIFDGEIKVTVSVGVTMTEVGVAMPAETLVGAAEAALAKAKWAGCDRVELMQA